MRTCLSFLVVEYMRQGISVGEACKKGIERLLTLQPLHTFTASSSFASSDGGSCGSGGASCGASSTDRTAPSLETMHSTLVVGVVAMDKFGNVRVFCAVLIASCISSLKCGKVACVEDCLCMTQVQP